MNSGDFSSLFVPSIITMKNECMKMILSSTINWMNECSDEKPTNWAKNVMETPTLQDELNLLMMMICKYV